MTERLKKTEFFEKYGHKLKPVRFDDPETGDYLIWSPEEEELADEYLSKGYDIVTVYEPAADGEDDIVELEFNKGNNPYKVGYLVIEKK